MCFYGGHSKGYKLGNHPKNIEPCTHRATTPPPCLRAACAPALLSQNQPLPQNLPPNLQQRVMHKARRRSTSNN